jgi:hypothetical protein
MILKLLSESKDWGNKKTFFEQLLPAIFKDGVNLDFESAATLTSALKNLGYSDMETEQKTKSKLKALVQTRCGVARRRNVPTSILQAVLVALDVLNGGGDVNLKSLDKFKEFKNPDVRERLCNELNHIIDNPAK